MSLVGLAVLIGWEIHSAALKSVFPGLVTMKANTAFGFSIAGIALILLTASPLGSLTKRLAAFLALLLVGLGTLTLGEYFFDWNAGIDEILARDVVHSVDTSRAGLMAPSTAFCFVLMGISLWMECRRSCSQLAFSVQSALAATLIAIGGVASVGQLSNAILHFHLWNYFWMAIHTALSFVFLGIGMLALAKNRRGLNWALSPAITIGFGLAILGMLAAACISWGYANELKEASAQATHTHQVLKAIEDVRANSADLESEQWGFVILGNDDLLANRDALKKGVDDDLQELRRLVSNQADQQKLADQLTGLAAERTRLGDQVIALRRQQGFSAAQKAMADGAGVGVSSQMESLLQQMRVEGYDGLKSRQNHAEAVSASTFLLQPLCIFMSLAILFLALFILNAGFHEQKLAAQTSARLAAIVNSSYDAIIGKDLEGKISSWNKGAERIFGYSAAEMVGSSIARLIPADRQNEELGIMDRIRLGQSVEHFDTLRRAKEGHLVDISVTVSPIRDADGKVVGASKVARDITERKRAQEALQESETQFRTMVNAIPQLAWMADANGSIFWYNQRWFDYTGTDGEAMAGWGWQSVHHPETLPKVLENWKKAIEQGRAFEMEFPLRAADGPYGWFLTRVIPLKDEAGRTLRWFGTNTDVSEKREANEAIRKINLTLEQRVAERTAELESSNKDLEAFSYSVSHDLRAPLRTIDGFSQALMEEFAAQLPSDGQRYLRNIRAGAQRMSALIDDLLEFSRLGRAPLVKQEITTARQVETVLQGIRAEQGQRTVDVRVGNLPPCLGAPALLEQVWVNLLSNAFKYTRQRDDAVVEIGCRCAKDRNVYFVRDNGAGFDMKYARKLFGVFQRLHRADEFEGTGVGLAIVQRILHRHGEQIWVEAAPNQGATFYFTLQPGNQAWTNPAPTNFGS